MSAHATGNTCCRGASSWRLCCVAVLGVAALSGCTSFTVPQQLAERAHRDIPARWSAAPKTSVQAVEAPFFRNLNNLLRQPPVLALLREAERANPDVNRTALALKAAGLLRQQIGARRFPAFDLNLSNARSQSLAGAANQYAFGLHSAWELDIWGKIADQRFAVQAEESALAHQHVAARSLLALTLLRTWIEASSLQAMGDNQRQQIAALQLIETIVLDSYRSGGAPLDDLFVARVEQQGVAADLLDTEASLARNRRTLHLLLGRMPATASLLNDRRWLEITVPPLQLPASALARRPDVQAAFQRLQALNAHARASHKALLPAITLTGNLERSATSSALSDLFGAAGSVVWSLVGGISQPLFHGARLQALARVAATNAQDSWWAYRKTLLMAAAEVENTLSMETSLRRQLQHLALASQQSVRLQQVHEEKYRNGLVDMEELIRIRMRHLGITIRLIRLRAALLDNRLLLAQALGFTMQPRHDAS